MTIIAAIHDPGTFSTWIGADSLTIFNGVRIRAERKWIRHDGWAIGHAGAVRTLNVIQANLTKILGGTDDPYDISCRIRAALIEDGFNGDKDPGPPSYDQNFILANASGIWGLGRCFSIVEISVGELWADGAGQDYALGAWHVLRASTGGPEEKLRTAIGAAVCYKESCGAPIWVERLEGNLNGR